VILAGDIGGTNTRLAAFETANGLRPIAKCEYRNHDYAALESIIGEFLKQFDGRITGAALAVAGPVVRNVVTGLNLPWRIDAVKVAATLKLPQVTLLNDLLALAYGISGLQPQDIEVLQAGEEDLQGNRAVIAAGTGLGESGLLRSAGGGFTPYPSEGGHGDFAPTNEPEAELFLYLHRKFGHVSTERVLSGMGIENLYCFLRDSKRFDEPKEIADELAVAKDRPAVIARYASAGKHALCVETLKLFASILAAETGNVALGLFATGGVYIGGGIAPKVAPFLRTPEFLDSFGNKGRMRALMEKIPVRLIINEHAGLIGAAAFARDAQEITT
jgi:glucokinase